MKAGALVALAVLVAIVVACCGCGRKAKPEPLWGAARIVAISDGSR